MACTCAVPHGHAGDSGRADALGLRGEAALERLIMRPQGAELLEATVRKGLGRAESEGAPKVEWIP